MTSVAEQPLFANKTKEAFRIATELYDQKPDWVTFFREVLGVEGVVRRLFEQEELAKFQQSAECAEIRQMVTRLQETNGAVPDDSEPIRVITVRLPKTLHESLKVEAHDRNVSMNRLCITKLLLAIEEEMAAAEKNGEALPAESLSMLGQNSVPADAGMTPME